MESWWPSFPLLLLLILNFGLFSTVAVAVEQNNDQSMILNEWMWCDWSTLMARDIAKTFWLCLPFENIYGLNVLTFREIYFLTLSFWGLHSITFLHKQWVIWWLPGKGKSKSEMTILNECDLCFFWDERRLNLFQHSKLISFRKNQTNLFGNMTSLTEWYFRKIHMCSWWKQEWKHFLLKLDTTRRAGGSEWGRLVNIS